MFCCCVCWSGGKARGGKRPLPCQVIAVCSWNRQQEQMALWTFSVAPHRACLHSLLPSKASQSSVQRVESWRFDLHFTHFNIHVQTSCALVSNSIMSVHKETKTSADTQTHLRAPHKGNVTPQPCRQRDH